MRSSPEDVVAEARRWVGTPYHHQAQLRGVGVDCVGLIVGVGKALGVMGEDFDARFKLFDGYSRLPNPRKMLRGMELFLERAPAPTSSAPGVGLIGWFEWREELPMHLAIIGSFEGRATMIHAYKPVGRCVEHTLDELWSARINSFWQYRGLA